VLTVRERWGSGLLREAQKALVSSTPGEVVFAADLAGGGRWAGTALVRELMERADADGITVIARTERGRLLEFYQGRGFTVAGERKTRWGSEVLMIRRPREPSEP